MQEKILDLNLLCNKVKLKFNDEEFKFFNQQMQKIINWSSEVLDLDTSNIEPLFSISEDFVKNPFGNYTNNKNEDIKQLILSNSASHDEDFFLVPKVIEKSN